MTGFRTLQRRVLRLFQRRGLLDDHTVADTASLFLGAVGIYAVLAYAVGRRAREIGIRIALGAQAADIRRLILGNAGRVIVIGIGAGLLAMLALTRFMLSMLFEVSATDPTAYAGVALLLALVALVACWLYLRHRPDHPCVL